MNGGHDGGLGAADMDAGTCTGAADAGSSRGVCDAGGAPSGGVILPVVTPFIIIINQPIVLVKKLYTNPARRELTLSADDMAFDGTGTFTFTAGPIRFFTQANGGRVVSNGEVFTGMELAMGVHLWAEGASPSRSMRDVELVLTLTPGSKPVNPPARDRMTAVEVTLDIHKTRTAVGADGVALTVAEKTSNPGRIVHVQDTSFHHGRALLVIHKAVPKDFTGTLVLTRENATVRVFDTPNETGAAAALPANYAIANGAITTPPVKRLWAEGAGVSGGVGDTGYRLGVQGVDTDGDRVKMTSVQFSNLSAVVSSTPPNQVRMANGPIPSHTSFHGGHAAADYDENFGSNAPLILLEGSLPAANNVNLAVTLRPNMNIGWSIQRNKFTASPDHAGIAALSASEPTLTPTAAGALTAHLKLDSVGSFHIRPFVDVDGGGHFEYNNNAGNRIDREPFIIMNLVLVRAQGFQNNSVQQTPNAAANDLAGNVPILAMNGVQISTGQFNSGANAGVHNIATITLIAGGADGRLGLDGNPARVFAGWVNNITRRNVVRSYLDATVAPPANHMERYVWASNAPAPPGSFGTFYKAPLAAPAGASSNAAPALLNAPVLDTTNFGGEGKGGNTCVGTEGAVGPPVAIVKKNLPIPAHRLSYGQDWTVEQWDSPGSGAGSNATMYPAAVLVGFTYEYDFRCDLVVWTNITRAPGATNDAACRLYATVQSDVWTVRYGIRFDPPGSPTAGTGHQVTAPTITMAKDPQRTRLARAVEGSGLEIRFPISLNCTAVDATT